MDAAAAAARRGVAPVARLLTTPASAFLAFNVVLAGWHLPPMYNAALEFHPVHILQHLMFIATSVLMWWPLSSRMAELPRLAFPGQMLFCFLMVIPMSVVSIYIVMADSLLYPAYATAPRLWGVTPMADQQYGGLIMWIPGGVFFYAVMTVVFFRWVERDEEDVPSAICASRASSPASLSPPSIARGAAGEASTRSPPAPDGPCRAARGAGDTCSSPSTRRRSGWR